ncbi:MAG: TraM recognition domain-containing protein [Pseudomonadota bacterium]|nr:TraM recognition domain-containing protein [Pseudomonadota bacterium]MDP2351259.1 TraM recognition domain-containing protein [Pseudomonadota bacterium]
MSQKALAYLENRVPPSPEKTNLKLFLDQYRSVNKEGVSSIDIKRLKETFGGVGGRMFMFGTGKFGQVMNIYTPEVDLFEAIKRNKIVYVMLPTMGKDVAAQNFGKMVVGDLRTAISWVQRLPETEKPWPPYLCFFDEAGSYVNASWSRMFEQARSAHICLLPAVQTLANLESVSPELKEMVIGNTWTKIYFKLGTQETAEAAADLIGLEKAVTRSLSFTGSQSDSTNRANASPDGGVSQGSGLATQEREEEVYKVSTDDLKALDKGEAIVTFGGSNIYHVRIPMISVPESVAAEIGAVKLNHYRPRFATGIDLFRRTDQYLTGADRQELGKG